MERSLEVALHPAGLHGPGAIPVVTLELVRDEVGTGEQLTPREAELVALLMTSPGTNEEMAERLTITPNTVKFHLTSVMRKLGVCSRTEVVAYAWQTGILVDGQWHPNA